MRAHDHEHDGPEVTRPEPARRDAPDAAAAECAAASGRWDAISAGGMLALQRAAGNRAVQQVLEHARRAATAHNAYGGHSASTVAVPPAGTGAVQREVFEGKDTENEDDLKALMTAVSNMTKTTEPFMMIKKLEQTEKLNGKLKKGEGKLLEALKSKKESLAAAKKQASSASSGSGTLKAEESSQQELDKSADIRTKTENLKGKAEILLDTSPEQFSTEYEQFEFDKLVKEWEQALAPERAYRRESIGLVREVEGKIFAVKKKRTQNEAQNKATQQQQSKKAEQDKQLKDRNEQAGKTQEEITDNYFELTIKPDKPWTRLLLQWLIGAAMNDLIAHPDPLVTGLLEHLEELEQKVVVILDEPKDDSRTVKGEAEWSQVTFWVGDLPPSTNEQGTKNLLASEEETWKVKRDDRVHELAKAFIHETTHWWQLRKYENVSHPWKLPQTKWPIPKESTVHEIPIENAPDDVQLAYKEFQELATGGPKKGFTEAEQKEVKDRFNAMMKPEYYNPGKKDMRARELVSHLIEIVYEWKNPTNFEKIFPECSKLLKRVMSE